MRRISLLLLIFLPFLSNAQYSENVQSDRPGQSLSPNTVGNKVLQFQAGYVHNNSEQTGILPRNSESGTQTSNQDFGNVKIRYGIFEKTEISAQTSLGKKKIERSGSLSSNYDENLIDFGFGVRQNFLNEVDHALALGAEAEYYYSYDDETTVRLTVSASKTLFEKLSLTANVGYSYEKQFLLTCNAAYQVTEKLGAFVEYYPQFGQKQLTTNDDVKLLISNVNTGLYYQLSPNFMIDVAGFFQTYDFREDGDIVSSGFSFQIGFTSRLDWRQ